VRRIHIGDQHRAHDAATQAPQITQHGRRNHGRVIQKQDARSAIGDPTKSDSRCPLSQPFDVDVGISFRKRGNNVG
jgi:hypothetical protein